ncbi:hypothetical protein [Streptomyces sp. SID13726]|uniref:hypothetical protein n=1 Tax=Streptomyces sp. SID13726 TaxID=2706058 RepID=UPI0013BB82C6|nr:hypothetical protein [Streptomyces sp. SID13726]NEA99799.1 hypothetical protein [Streptomyces sp. SID13726]
MDKRGARPHDPEDSETSRAVPGAGYPASVHSAVNVAAPMLAAAAVTLTGVVAADEIKFRWPGAAMLCLMLAAASLIASVQFGFRAQMYRFTEDELDHWFVGAAPDPYPEGSDSKVHTLAVARNTWEIKVRPAVYTYNVGTVLLGLGLAGCLMPKPDSEQSGVRWAAMAVALALTLGELVWALKLNVPHTPAMSPPLEGSPTAPVHVEGPGGDASAPGTPVERRAHDDA